MSDMDLNNELFSNISGSFSKEESYQNVLRELNLDSGETTLNPVMIYVTKFGKFSIVSDTIYQIKDIKSKLGLKGLLPLYPGIVIAKDKQGSLKYVLMYDLKSKFPTIHMN